MKAVALKWSVDAGAVILAALLGCYVFAAKLETFTGTVGDVVCGEV